MDDTLQGKVALVTGAARRIGAAIARRLHACGANVIVHYRGAEQDAARLEKELNAARAGSALRVKGDLLAPIAPKAVISAALERWQRLDLLVNNASAFYPTPVDAVTPTQWDELFAANVRAPFFLAQAAAPRLAEREGAIVNIVDIYAERPLADYSIYSMTKAALAMMTKSLARELGPRVRVNGVAPGAVLWPDSGKSYAAREELIARTPLKRTGSPEDVAGAVLWLLRDAPFVTGEIVRVDGGRHLSI